MNDEKTCVTTITNREFNSSCLYLETNLWGADTDVTVQEVVSDFKLITCTVKNVLQNKQERLLIINPKPK